MSFSSLFWPFGLSSELFGAHTVDGTLTELLLFASLLGVSTKKLSLMLSVDIGCEKVGSDRLFFVLYS